MISPELLRHYSFFGLLTDAQLKNLAMISSEEHLTQAQVIFQESQPAEALYFLLEGDVDLYFAEEGGPVALEDQIPAGSINPGEPFGISAIIEPYLLTSTAVASVLSRVIRIDAIALRQLFEKDSRLAFTLTRQAAMAVMQRLHSTRIQLAAAWA